MLVGQRIKNALQTHGKANGDHVDLVVDDPLRLAVDSVDVLPPMGVFAPHDGAHIPRRQASGHRVCTYSPEHTTISRARLRAHYDLMTYQSVSRPRACGCAPDTHPEQYNHQARYYITTPHLKISCTTICVHLV